MEAAPKQSAGDRTRRHRACLLSSSAVSDSFHCQAPRSVGFPRQEYWSGLPFPSPGDLPGTGAEPASLQWQADFSHSLP